MKNLKNCLYGKYSDKNTKFNPNQNVEIYREILLQSDTPILPLVSGSKGRKKVTVPKKRAVQKNKKSNVEKTNYSAEWEK